MGRGSYRRTMLFFVLLTCIYRTLMFVPPSPLPSLSLRVPAPVVSWAVDRLATVDYTVANRVTEDVAHAVHFVYDHHLPPQWVPVLVHALQTFDDIGSMLITLVVWLAQHSVRG